LGQDIVLEKLFQIFTNVVFSSYDENTTFVSSIGLLAQQRVGSGHEPTAAYYWSFTALNAFRICLPSIATITGLGASNMARFGFQIGVLI
jgi:hypothetical protein